MHFAHAPAQDLARGGVAMVANETRMLLTFREDMLGRTRAFQGLKLAEDHMRFANACRSASWSAEIRRRSWADIVPRPRLKPRELSP